MSTVGTSIETSALQAAQAQRTAAKARDKERADTNTGQRLADILDLKIAGVEATEAARKLPGNDSEENAGEQRSKHHHPPADDEQPRVDLTA